MKAALTPLVAIVLCLGIASAPAADEQIKDSPDSPLKIGTKWHYRSGMNTVVVQVAKYEKVGNVMCAVMEASREGKVAGKELIGMKADGVYKMTMQGKELDKPYCIL